MKAQREVLLFAARVAAMPLPVPEAEVAEYRDRTLALLRRYFRLALETGRLPSVLGRECFRARVSWYRLHTFEDAVIFVHDVERCLELLAGNEQKIVANLVLLGNSLPEVAHLLGLPLRSVERGFAEGVDRLSRIFLRLKLLATGAPRRREPKSVARGELPRLGGQACQARENTENALSA